MKEFSFSVYEKDMPDFEKALRIFDKKLTRSYSDQAIAEKMLMEKVYEILKENETNNNLK